ncbi:MAG: CpaF family protein [Eubacterium sp.]
MQVEELKEIVLAELNFTRETPDEELHNIIDEVMLRQSEAKYMSINKRGAIHKELFDSMRGLGILQELIDDDEITEIMVNGKDNIFIEKSGSIVKYEAGFCDEQKLMDVIQQIAAKSNRRVNETVPIVDTRLDNGSRVNVVLKPIAIDGPVITIRKFPKDKIVMSQLIEWNSISKEAADFLKVLVQSGYNIFVSGGTGSGKTTFLNVLSDFILPSERVITIEDSAELQLHSIENLVRMEVRQANAEGENEVTIRDLIRTSLRMRPDRIIVGEVRGRECLDMLQAMNTGHDGSMSTGHSNSTKDMLSRLETMVLMDADMPLPAIKSQIAAGIDIIVHLGRMRDKSRRVLEIAEIGEVVDGNIQIRPLFMFKETGEDENGYILGELNRTEYKLINTAKLISAGIDISI